MLPWHRWREPLAVVLLIALGLMLALRGLALVLAVEAGSAGGLLGSIPRGDDLLVLVTAAAVLWCATPVAAAEREPRPSAHAWPVALAGAVIVGLTVLGWLVLSIWNIVALASRPTPDVGFALLVIEGLLRLVVPVAALLAVIAAVRRERASRRDAAHDGRPALPTSATETSEEREVPAPPERLPAAWQADEATGAVWLTADDAAQGRPGLSWAESGESTGPAASGWATPAPTGRTAEPGARGDADGPTASAAPEVAASPGASTEAGSVRPAAEDDDLR